MRYRKRSFSALSHAVTAFTVLAVVVSCSDDKKTGEGDGKTGDVATTLPGASLPETTTTLPLDTPTTFIANCTGMPSAAAISAIVGIPLADGQVVATGTCQFVGLNEQARMITLTLLTDTFDQAAFNDLQLSLGASTPLNDPTLPNAFIDPTSLIYINANGAIYTVRTLITDATPAEQVPLSAAVLHLWLGV